MPALTSLRRAWLKALETLLLQRPLWRHVGHALTYALMLIVVAWAGTRLNALDWRLAALLAPNDPPWPAAVEVVDVSWDLNPADLADFRQRLAAALVALAELPTPPRIVVVDVAVTIVPLGLKPLRDATQALKERGVELVVAANRNAYGPNVNLAEAARYQGNGPEVYAGWARLGHTSFEGDAPNFWYYPCLPLQAGLEPADLPALPHYVGERLRAPEQSVRCPPPDAPPIVFQPGSTHHLHRHLWTLREGRLLAAVDPTRSIAALAHAVVVVGNVKFDQVKGRAGPDLVAWAIGNAIAPSPPTAPRLLLLTDWRWTLGFALVFSGIAVALFAGLQRVLRLRRFYLLAPAAAALAITLSLMAALLVLMRYGFHVVYLQVSYVVVMVGVALLLAGHALRTLLRERAMYTDVVGEPGQVTPVYDVFVSYSHTPAENMDWVDREIVAPLEAAEFAGRKLKVFIDRKSLHVGTSWYFQLAEYIETSRCMVAVYSSDYFQKNFCTFELGKAVVREIAARGKAHGKGFALLPVMRGDVGVPAAFSHLQFMKADSHEKLVKEVLAKLRETA